MAGPKPWERYAAQSGGQVFTLPPNPEDEAERAREAARDAAAQADRQADNARADAALDLQQQTAALNAELKRLQIQKAATGGGAANRDRLSRLNQLVRQIDRVQTLYDENIGTTKGILAGAQDYLPTNENARFDAAGAALSQQGLAAFRVPGTGTVSDRDAIMFDRANLPTAATRDAAIEEQLLGLRSRVEEELRTLGQPVPQWSGVQAESERDENELAAASAVSDPSPPDLPPANEGGLDPGMAPASGATRRVRDDRLAGQIDAMINAEADEATINAVLSQQGYQALPLGSLAAARSWMKANPGQRYYGANPGKEVPLSLPQRIAGSPFGAGLAHYTNAATAGTVGAMAGDRGRGALDAMQAMNPGASLAGNIAGGITGAMGAELGLGARLAGTGLAKFAPRIADAGYGGVFGFNEADEGEGLMGAAKGATVGALGGALGERAMRGAGAVARGVTDPMVQRLREAGVPMTVGQAVGNSGAVGAGVKKIEDALTSVPFVGNMVEARRMEGLEAFNRSAFGIGAAPTGGQVQDIGAAGIGQLNALKSDAYRDALDPVTLDLANDPQALADIAGAGLTAHSIPQVGENAAEAIGYRVGGGMSPAGTMAGRDFQEAYRGLAQDGRAAANGPYAAEFAGTMRQGQDALAEALERQNPGAFGGFQNANAANRRLQILADAVGRAKNADDQIFTPAQLNMADTANATRLTGRVASSSGQRPFAELAEAGQSVLPSRLPDSGTSTRAMVGFGLANAGLVGGGAALGGTEGAGVGTGLGLGATIALALGGSKPAQQMLTGAVLNRPAIARAVGEAFARNSQLGGWSGAGVLTPLLVGPQ